MLQVADSVFHHLVDARKIGHHKSTKSPLIPKNIGL